MRILAGGVFGLAGCLVAPVVLAIAILTWVVASSFW